LKWSNGFICKVMRRNLYLCFLLVFVCKFSSAQDYEHYKAARCTGEIPADFLKLASEKADDAANAVQGKNLARKERKEEMAYAIRANFLTDELLSSGQILYGDPMTSYINKVADVLLETDPELRKELRFYVLRSHVPNAYATHTGVILISIGLLARVENEAQIACILAHEIHHYVKKHSLQQYKKSVELRKEANRASRSELDNRLRELYRFSKEAEMEADNLGFELLQKTKYNLKEGIAVFDMLRYTEYPFLEISLTLDSFETENYRYPDKLREEITKNLEKKDADARIVEDAEEDDENSTHPSLGKRIDKLKDMLGEVGDKGGAMYIQSEAAFADLQRSARCELLLLFIRRADFGKSLYLGKVMELVYGKTSFTTEVIAMSWYGLATHRMFLHDLNSYGCSVTYSLGDWRPMMSMFRKMSAKELVSLCMRELYTIGKETSNRKIMEMRDAVFVQAQKDQGIKLEEYLNYTVKKERMDVEDTTANSEAPASTVRNPRSRTGGKGKDAVKSKDYYYAVFYDIENKDTLEKYFRKVLYDAPDEVAIAPKKTKKKSKKEAEPVVVNSVAFFEPVYNEYRISGKGKWQNDYYYEESMERELSDKLVDFGNKCEMPVTIISNSNNAGLTTEAINRYMVLNDWFLERLNNDTNTMMLWNREEAKDAMENVGTPFLGWVGLKYTQERRSFDPYSMVLCLVLYPIFPGYLYWQLGSDKDFSYYYVVMDTRTSTITTVNSTTYEHRNQQDFMDAQLYKLLYNIKYKKH
jgi:hypothetical protein